MWTIFTILSVLVLLLSILLAVWRGIQRKRYRISPLYILLVGVFLADFLALFPPYYLTVLEGNGILKSLFMVFHDTLQLFTINNDFSLILEHVKGISQTQRNLYTVYVAFLYAFTPILTVGFGLSFFRNLSAYWKYIFCYNSNVYVFSHWNRKAAALAKSIIEKDKHAVILLTSRTKEADENEELNRLARAVGSIDFASHICNLKLKFHNKDRNFSFFFIQENSAINVKEAVTALKNYKKRPHTSFYVFSNVNAHESILYSADSGEVIVRRINSMQSLIYMFLFGKGMEIFESATVDEMGVKRISIALIGFGSYNTEFLRTLPWFCTQVGYATEIHVFEPDSSKFSSFEALYPDLNYVHSPHYLQDAFYSIHFHAFNTDSLEFSNYITGHHFTFALVITGDNDRNLRISLRLRTLFSRKEEFPLIYTRISDPILSDCCKELYVRGNEKCYDIRLIGSLEETYSYTAIIESSLHAYARKINNQYVVPARKADGQALSEEELRVLHEKSDAVFWSDEFIYSHSMSTALHHVTIEKLYPEGSTNTKPPIEVQSHLEFSRWVTFMYTQGYAYVPNQRDPLSLAHKRLPKNYEERKDFLTRF